MACQYLLKQWWKCWKEYMNCSIYKTKCMIGLYNPSLTCPNKKGFFYIPLNNIVIGIFCYPNCSLFRAISATYSFKIAGYRPNRFHLKHWIVSKRNTGIYRSVMYCILDDGVRHYHPSWIFTKGLQLAISSGLLVLYVGLVFDTLVVSNISCFQCNIIFKQITWPEIYINWHDIYRIWCTRFILIYFVLINYKHQHNKGNHRYC